MQKVPIGRWLGTMVFFWGIVSLTAAPCKDFAGIMVNRFFLGVFEATNTPIFAIIVGQYYTRDEQPLRACIWWSCAGIAGFFGDSMALKMGETHGALATWQVQFTPKSRNLFVGRRLINVTVPIPHPWLYFESLGHCSFLHISKCAYECLVLE
jgi:MFS family permease